MAFYFYTIIRTLSKRKDKINKILFNHQYKRNIVIRKAESIHSPITFWYGKYIILIPSLYFKSINDKN